jgi:hypothetical protein
VALSSTTAGRRLLLTDVTIMYSISIVSGMDASTLVTKFNEAVSTGVFLTSLNQLSGLKLSLIMNTVVFDATPTTSPTSAPQKGICTPPASSLHLITLAAIFKFLLHE